MMFKLMNSSLGKRELKKNTPAHWCQKGQGQSLDYTNCFSKEKGQRGQPYLPSLKHLEAHLSPGSKPGLGTQWGAQAQR